MNLNHLILFNFSRGIPQPSQLCATAPTLIRCQQPVTFSSLQLHSQMPYLNLTAPPELSYTCANYANYQEAVSG